MVGSVPALGGVVVVFFWKALSDRMEVVAGDAIDGEVSGVPGEGGERFELRKRGRGEEGVEELVAGGRRGGGVQLGVEPAGAEQQLVGAGAGDARALHAAPHRDAGAQGQPATAILRRRHPAALSGTKENIC